MGKINQYAVYFDGTSHFAESITFIADADTVQIFTSNNLEECENKADELNEEL